MSTNYGYVPATRVMRGIGPVIGCYGGRDRTVAAAPRLLVERLAPLGIQPEVHIFPDAGHSFLTDGNHPIARRLSPRLALGDYPTEREAGWKLILDFFDRQLT